MHKSVMLEEAISGLKIKPSGIYIDATFGRGGHSKKILESLGPDAKILIFDKDPQAIAVARELQQHDPRIVICQGSFKEIQSYCDNYNLTGKIDGILYDLGVSSPQLDEASRGFSFMHDGPLDMRMDPERGQSAAEWLAVASAEEISKVLKVYGEERFAKRIAGAIIARRSVQAITTTTDLANIIAKAVPFKEKHKHPATRSFQAIRIYINQELDDLQISLDRVLQVLAPGGRLVAISFHSLEDRIVKQFIAAKSKDAFPAKMPVPKEMLHTPLKKIGKALKPQDSEVNINVRARSAILRIAEKV